MMLNTFQCLLAICSHLWRKVYSDPLPIFICVFCLLLSHIYEYICIYKVVRLGICIYDYDILIIIIYTYMIYDIYILYELYIYTHNICIYSYIYIIHDVFMYGI